MARPPTDVVGSGDPDLAFEGRRPGVSGDRFEGVRRGWLPTLPLIAESARAAAPVVMPSPLQSGSGAVSSGPPSRTIRDSATEEDIQIGTRTQGRRRVRLYAAGDRRIAQNPAHLSVA